MKETVITLGNSRSLVGILCEPDTVVEASARPKIILLNAGMVHRVGPFRLNTILARTMAEAGFISLRLDLSGIGDSTIDSASLSQDEQMLEDVRLAIDFLDSSRGGGGILLVGLCTGADNAHKAAVVFDQVKGAIFLDGYAYPTMKFVLNRYWPVISSSVRLLKALLSRIKAPLKKIRQKLASGDGGDFDEPDNLFIWKLPPKSRTARELEALVQRKTALCYIYTTGSFYRYNYLHQFRESFKGIDFDDLLSEGYFPEMDHTYILANDRGKLVEFIINWLGSRYGSVKGVQA